jgi:hypothetical protein
MLPLSAPSTVCTNRKLQRELKPTAEVVFRNVVAYDKLPVGGQGIETLRIDPEVEGERIVRLHPIIQWSCNNRINHASLLNTSQLLI